MRIQCPFLTWNENIIKNKCPYIDDRGFCDDIDINPGNSDAFCGGAVEGKVELLEDE